MDEVNANMAEGYVGLYDKNKDHIKWRKNIYSYPPIGSPDSGAYTTVIDLDIFIRNLKSNRVLNSEYTNMLFSPHCKFASPFNCGEPSVNATIRKGYAFEFVEINGNIFCMRKEGLNDGVGAMLSYYPEMDVTIIIMSNQTMNNGDCEVWEMHRKIQTIIST